MICGADANQPDAGVAGDSVTAGPGEAAESARIPGPCWPPTRRCRRRRRPVSTTRICSLAIAAGTASDPTNDPPLVPRSRLCHGPAGLIQARPRGESARRRWRSPRHSRTCRRPSAASPTSPTLRRDPIRRCGVVDVAGHPSIQHLRADGRSDRPGSTDGTGRGSARASAAGHAVGADEALRRRWPS